MATIIEISDIIGNCDSVAVVKESIHGGKESPTFDLIPFVDGIALYPYKINFNSQKKVAYCSLII